VGTFFFLFLRSACAGPCVMPPPPIAFSLIIRVSSRLNDAILPPTPRLPCYVVFILLASRHLRVFCPSSPATFNKGSTCVLKISSTPSFSFVRPPFPAMNETKDATSSLRHFSSSFSAFLFLFRGVTFVHIFRALSHLVFPGMLYSPCVE